MEEGLGESRTEISNTGLELKHLKEEVKSGMDTLAGKMDRSHNQHEEIRDELRALSPRLIALEAVKVRSARRIKTMKGGAWGLFMALFGGVAIKAGEWIWAHL